MIDGLCFRMKTKNGLEFNIKGKVAIENKEYFICELPFIHYFKEEIFKFILIPVFHFELPGEVFLERVFEEVDICIDSVVDKSEYSE